MDVRLVHVFCCPACGQQSEQALEWMVGQHVPVPTPPSGWTRLNDRFYCPKHVLCVVVDFLDVARIEGSAVQFVEGTERVIARAVAEHAREVLARHITIPEDDPPF